MAKAIDPTQHKQLCMIVRKLDLVARGIERGFFGKGRLSTYYDDSGFSLLHLAAIHHETQLIKFLLSKGISPLNQGYCKQPPLTTAIRLRGSRFKISTIKLLNESINEPDHNGQTALFFASTGAGLFGSKQGNEKIVMALLNAGADANIKDKSGHRAIDYAIQSNESSKTDANASVVWILKNATSVD